MERSSTNQVRRDQEHSTGELITMMSEQAVADHRRRPGQEAA